jgi:hypothetical protein
MTKRNIPLSEFLGISRNDSGNLYLPVSDNVKNHLGTIHAAAQFSLAELASGAYLEDIFPEYKTNVYAVLRKTQTRYRSPGETELTAFPIAGAEEIRNLQNSLQTRNRGIITVSVKLMDYCGKCVFEGLFEWYIQKSSK